MPAVLYMPPYVVRDNQLDLIFKELTGVNHDSSSNDSRSDYIAHPHHPMFYFIFMANSVTFTAGLIGNCLLIMAYSKTKTIRTTTNTYILSMALTDLLVAFSCGLMPVLTDLAGTWPFSETACKISQSVMEFSTFANVLTLTAISIERYYAVMYPIEMYFSTKRCTALATLCIWIIAFLCSIPKFINSGIKVHRIEGIQGHTIVEYCAIHQDKTSLARYLSLVDVIFFYTIPLCIVSVLYTIVSRHLMKVTAHVASTQRMTPAQVNMARVRFKVANMVKVLAAVFFVGFLPHNILILRIFFLQVTDTYWNSAASYAYCYGCLHYWLNPVALYLCNDTVRERFNHYLSRGVLLRKTSRTAPAPSEDDSELKHHRKSSDSSNL